MKQEYYYTQNKKKRTGHGAVLQNEDGFVNIQSSHEASSRFSLTQDAEEQKEQTFAQN